MEEDRAGGELEQEPSAKSLGARIRAGDQRQ